MINLVNPVIGLKEKLLTREVLNSKLLASGKYVSQFEQSFAKYSEAKFGIANSNGTVALHTALLMCGVGYGDKVATTPFSFVATSNSILFCRATPIFIDIDPKTFNINPDKLEIALKREKNIKAVLIVHLYGLPCNMDMILELKKKYGFKLIEDACQAHGAKFNNKKVGSFGDAAAFSFYATKNMTTGEGGITLTNNVKANKYGRQIINHGKKLGTHSKCVILGYNYRLTNIAAALGIAQLEQLESWIKKRIKCAEKYNNNFKNLNFLRIPYVPEKCRHVFHQYTIRVLIKERENFIKYLLNNGIESRVYYDTVLYKEPLYKQLGYKSGLCIEAEKAANEVLSLPVHPSLSKANIDRIIEVVKGYKHT
ncbi:MAG: DegT/DnrJ/EryC1/StrS family aminotransferase [Endomicrobium sp.]|jgi:dTDP-4-amino-4,6-dideoxygalactose transaminase|nr:DegT/DnrJ/EryC1/StrS family aminotransferase [Endomicrobium sp.]